MVRPYEKTHPWINFHFDLNTLNYRIWLLLGEAKSKCEHIKGAPLLPETIQRLHNIYLAKGALATTAIEGNTLTENEVEKRIKGELSLPPSKEYLGQEIDNIVKAINIIGGQLLEENETDRLRVDSIKEYNEIVLRNLPLSEGVVPGKIRNYSVGIATYRGAPHEDCEYLLQRYVDWLNQEFVFPVEQKVIYGILKAILAHLYFVWIHPFGDGNGRTARLIEFQIMLSSGIPAAAAHLLSNHYNATRSMYYQMLDRSSKGEDQILGFVLYALQGFVDGLKGELEEIQNEQIRVHWINHIHNRFRGMNSKTDDRQKELVLELTKANAYRFSFEEIRHKTPRIAENYAALSGMTIKRDLTGLIEMKLLTLENKEYALNIKVLGEYLQVTAVRD
jgi:Fic family protein